MAHRSRPPPFGSVFLMAKRISGSGVHRMSGSLAIREKNES